MTQTTTATATPTTSKPRSSRAPSKPVVPAALQVAPQAPADVAPVPTPSPTPDSPTTAAVDPVERVRKHLKTRVYLVVDQKGVKTYVKASSKAKALLYIATGILKCASCTGEELFNAGKSNAEIHDATGMVVSDAE